MSMPSRNLSLRGSTMAAMCVTAIGGALGAMYFIDRNVKKNEGVASPYKDGAGLSGGSDVNMTSADVSRAVSVPKPGKERLTTTQK
ncbi:hypothetical protein Agabi119p4_8153 [Agaricus bisporus var. burnettii]|uniref:Uncharacterized protein n=1 Tax=Agaricus bisporus var. burnettii TaxID=192524 RepID=A0A8H7C621_AGABI|nr:hypothetical protein Agabi119p4_8153 [Agaricus bisporus var. burnettii]